MVPRARKTLYLTLGWNHLTLPPKLLSWFPGKDAPKAHSFLFSMHWEATLLYPVTSDKCLTWLPWYRMLLALRSPFILTQNHCRDCSAIAFRVTLASGQKRWTVSRLRLIKKGRYRQAESRADTLVISELPTMSYLRAEVKELSGNPSKTLGRPGPVQN